MEQGLGYVRGGWHVGCAVLFAQSGRVHVGRGSYWAAVRAGVGGLAGQGLPVTVRGVTP